MKNKENIEENNKLEEKDSNIEERENMAKKRRAFKSDRQRKAVMAKLSKSRWVTKSYSSGSSATFYVPKIKTPIHKTPKFTAPKHPLYNLTKKKKQRR